MLFRGVVNEADAAGALVGVVGEPKDRPVGSAGQSGDAADGGRAGWGQGGCV